MVDARKGGLHMPRKKRNFMANAFYHCILRGNNRSNVFPTADDMFELYRAFEHVHAKYPFTIIAFCFMTNHYHILIRAPENNLSKILSLVNKRYSDSYRFRYRFQGRIYQRRFFSSEVTSFHALLEVSAYIHRNPMQTRVPMVKNLEDYPYSSFPIYTGIAKKHPPFLDIDFLPKLLRPPFPPHINGYIQYVLHRDYFAVEDTLVDDQDTLPISLFGPQHLEDPWN